MKKHSYLNKLNFQRTLRNALSIVLFFISFTSFSQAVFEIESPSSIKGFYKFGLSDSTIDSRWGNGNTANKAVSASLALGKDSLAREALELNVKGKIAVLYRGGASFTDIALRAQAAGAVACIIVNNRPINDAAQGGAFSMAVSTGSQNLKIPLIMLSQEDGALITNMIRKGEDVRGYIGKKRMLSFDVKVTKDWIATPLYRTRPVFLAKKGMISDTLGLSVINAGSNEAENIVAIADVSFGGKSIYSDTVLIPSLAANGGSNPNDGDTMYYTFKKPFQPDFDLAVGAYTLKYYLRQLDNKDTSIVSLNDEFQDDNQVEWYFTISDSTMAVGNIISYTSSTNNNTVYTNKGNWSTANNSGANLKDFKSCITYHNTNSDKVNINSMDFLAYSFETNGTLQNAKVGVVVYKWKTMPPSIFDPNYKLSIDGLTPLVESEYVFKNAYKSDYGTYSFKNDGLTLDPKEMYLFCVSTTISSIGFGYNKNEPSMWPANAFNKKFTMPAYSDGTFYNTGLGSDRIPAITLNFAEKAVKSSSKDIVSYAITSPAVTAKIGIDKVELSVSNATDVTNLVAKFKLSAKATMTINNINQVSESSVNDFTNTLVAIVTAEDGSTKTYQIIITKAPKSSEKLIVSCKQGASFGVIENDKVTFHLPSNTDLNKLIFSFTVSPFAKAYILDSLGNDKDSTFITDVTVVNALGEVKIKVVAEDGSVKYYNLIVKLIKSSLKQLTSFSIASPAAAGTIKDGMVDVIVPKGTDLTKLIANFTSSTNSSVFVNGINQVSGVTTNNFSNALTYTVVAEDGSSLDFKVVVNFIKSSGNSIINYSLVNPNVTGVINGTNIIVTVPKATDLKSLIAKFELSPDALVKVKGIVQNSGVTKNDFSNTVIYTVTSESGESKNYTVVVQEDKTSTLKVTSCGNYEYNGKIYSQSGEYKIDEFTTLFLTVNNPSYTSVSKVACESYNWNGQNYSQSGTFNFISKTTKGCDSTITLYLTINKPSNSSITHSTCGSYSWNGTTYTQSGKYDFITKNVNGCDSTATLYLTINKPSTSSIVYSTCGSYTWNGKTYTQSGKYDHITKAVNGCDSIITLNLTILSPTTSTTLYTSTGSYTWNGVNYTQSGLYTYKTKNAKGCDSVATLLLTINAPGSSTTIITSCDSYIWNGTTYNQTGTYSYKTKNSKGNDSIATLLLTINNSIKTTITQTACESYTWNGKTYTQSGKYDFVSKSIKGCDSTATLFLTINTPKNTVISESTCSSYIWNGKTYTQSGKYTNIIKSSNGCDSVVTLNLTILSPTTSTTMYTSNSSYTWNGVNYIQSGIYTYKTKNKNGCDSTATLLLTVNAPGKSTTIINACDSYVWNGSSYNQTGTYLFKTKNAQGSDSTAILLLTINKPTISMINETACGSYSWNGKTYTQSGKYEFTTKNSKGCDSITTLYLTVNQNSTSSILEKACGSFTWKGKTYNQSGKYEFVTKNARGCDSIVTLDLTIYVKPTLEIEKTNSTLISSQSNGLYQWFNCDSLSLVLPNSTDQKYIPIKTGNYAVKINLNGCTETTSCIKFESSSTMGIDTKEENQFSIYPNPNNGIFSVSGLNTGSYKIFDVLGTEVYSFKIQTNEILQLDLSHLAKGVYHFATDDAHKLNGKVIITD